MIAHAMGGRRTFNSGAGLEKGDGRVPHSMKVVDGAVFEQTDVALRLESKTTNKGSYFLKGTEWEKLWSAAMGQGEVPVFVVRLTDRYNHHLRLVALPTGYATALLHGPVRCEANQSPSSKGFGISEKVWAEAVAETRVADQLGGENHVPHTQFFVQGQRKHHLTLLTWEWFKYLRAEVEG
jgi:hypothetical protein